MVPGSGPAGRAGRIRACRGDWHRAPGRL